MTHFEIFVNNKPYKTDLDKMTGQQIKALAGVPSDYELFLVKGKESEPIGSNQTVEIKNGEHFRAIPPGTFGHDAAANS